MRWPASVAELQAEQARLAQLRPPGWRPPGRPVLAGGCFVCFERGAAGPGRPGESAWAGAALFEASNSLLLTGAAACPAGPRASNTLLLAVAAVEGRAPAAYGAGLLALREGALLETAVRALPGRPEVLLVDATGRDHPRGAGLALHLGAVLDLPTVGVTHRPLLAHGDWPPDERGAASPLLLHGGRVGAWVRTRAGTRPLAVHAAWRTDADTAVAIVLALARRARTPEPLREARRVARNARAGAS